MNEQRDTLRGHLARVEHDIAQAREANDLDTVDALLDEGLEVEALLDGMRSGVVIEHVVPTDVRLVVEVREGLGNKSLEQV